MVKDITPDQIVQTAIRQLQTSYLFKQPRIRTIKKFRRLYNADRDRQLRSAFNVPIPVFAGMIDTLQADLNDRLIIEYQHRDPADWKKAEKANAAIKQESESERPGASWDEKFTDYRFEKIMTGRGIMAFSAQSDGGYESTLEVVPFEDFFFEPLGGGSLESHIFCGRQNIWRSMGHLKKLAKAGIYNSAQVKLLEGSGKEYKPSGIWDATHDVSSRFEPLGLSPDSNNYVGEEMFQLCEWVLEYKGRRWYLVFEPYTGTWVRLEKNSDVCSADYMPFISSASHKDLKNFASKGFGDDLYPVADSVIVLFNQDLTNRQKRNLNARAYDRQMIKDVAKFDEAQHRPDAIVPVETFNGTRRISEGIYEFKSPEITGTIDLIDWIQRDTGKQLGVTEMQQGAAQPASKKVGVTYAELGQISKRVAFKSKPFKKMGKELGERFFVSLKDYLKEPMSVEMLGEKGVEWDVIKRTDLSVHKSFQLVVSSELERSNENETASQRKVKALEMTAQSPRVNGRVRDEYILRDVGGFDEHDVALLMDPTAETDRETLAEASAAIQSIVIRGKKPKLNYNADLYFIKRLSEFAKKHRDTLSASKFKLLMECVDEHIPVVQGNVDSFARRDARKMMPQGRPVDGEQPVPTPANALGATI